MIRVLFVSQRAEKIEQLSSLFDKLRYDFVSMSDEGMIIDYLSVSECEIVIFDTLSEKIKFSYLLRKIRPALEKSALLILVNSDFCDKELMKQGNALIYDDMPDEHISNIVGMNLRMRSSLEKLAKTN